MRRKAIKITVICLSSFLFLWGCEEFFRREIGGFAGSYPFVEYWELKATEREVIDAIKELMQEKVLLQPLYQKESFPERNSEYDWDSQEMIEYSKKAELDSLLPLPPKTKANTKNEYWLYIDFYYDDTGEVAHTWTRPSFDSTVTTFALVRLNQKLINRDYWFLANRREINKFKTKIVDKIQDKINRRRKAAHNNSYNTLPGSVKSKNIIFQITFRNWDKDAFQKPATSYSLALGVILFLNNKLCQ